MQKFFFVVLIISILILSACVSTTNTVTTDISPPQSQPEEEQITTVEQHILAIIQRIRQHELTHVDAKLNTLKAQVLSNNEVALFYYAKALYQWQLADISGAMQQLDHSNAVLAAKQSRAAIQVDFFLLKAQLLNTTGRHIASAQLRAKMAPLITSETAYLNNHHAIWQTLRLIPPSLIAELDSSQFSTELMQWFAISLIAQHNEQALDQQIEALNNWQINHPIHPASLIPFDEMAAIRKAAASRPSRVAVILPFDGKYQSVANAIRDGIMQSYYQTHYQPTMAFYTANESLPFIETYHLAITDGADLIIGPLLKNQLEELYTQKALPVPTIALNKLDNASKPKHLYEFSLSTNDEMDSLIQLSLSKNHQRAAIIVQNANWAEKSMQHFIQQWQANGGNILSMNTFEQTKDQSRKIQQLLNIDKSKLRYRDINALAGPNIQFEPRRRKDIDMILLLAKSKEAASLKPLLSFHYANDIPTFASSNIYRGYPNTQIDRDLNGITFTDIPLVIEGSENISKKYQRSSFIRMYGFGQDAFLLSERLSLLQDIADMAFYGATGKLTLNEQTLKRETFYGFFKQGQVKPLYIDNKADDNT